MTTSGKQYNSLNDADPVAEVSKDSDETIDEAATAAASNASGESRDDSRKATAASSVSGEAFDGHVDEIVVSPFISLSETRKDTAD